MKIIISILLVGTIISLAILIGQKYYIKAEYEQLNTKIAITLVNDITNRMYMNYQGAIQGNKSFYQEPFDMQQKSEIEQQIDYFCYTEDDGCTPDTIAANDVTYWKQAIIDNLPNGVGKIQSSSEDPYSYVINISWNDYNNKKKFVTSSITLPYPSS